MPITQEQVATIRQYLHNSAFQIVKIAVCGLKGVGKTSLLRRHCQDFFIEVPVYDPIEDGLWRKQVLIQDTSVMVDWVTYLVEWLPSRLDQGGGWMRQLVRGCEACILVYDVTNRTSFEKLTDLYEEVSRYLEVTATTGQKPVLVVANKTDLPTTAWTVTMLEGDEFAENIGAGFAQTSAKIGFGVDDMVVEMVSRILLGRVAVEDKVGRAGGS